MARKMRKSTAITPVEYSGLQDVIDIPSRRDLFSNADRDAVEIGELYRKGKSLFVDDCHVTSPSSSLKTNLVVGIAGRDQWPARRSVRLTRDRAGARRTRNALVAAIARDHRLADQPHGGQQKLDHCVLRPGCDRL